MDLRSAQDCQFYDAADRHRISPFLTPIFARTTRIFCAMPQPPRKRRSCFAKFFRSKQPSGSTSEVPIICSGSITPAAVSSWELSPLSGYPLSSEQQSVPATPPAGEWAAETYGSSEGGLQDRLRPMPPPEIRRRTYDALKKRLTAEELCKVNWEGTTAEGAAKNIEDLKKNLGGKKHSKTMNQTLQNINKYCLIVDTAIQHHPDITALVWAGARTLIQVSRTINNVVLEGKSHSLPSWRPITMKPLRASNRQ